jgi:hypothetical protein
MNRHGSLFVLFIALAAAQAAASTPLTSAGEKKTSESAALSHLAKPASAPASTPDSLRKSLAFQVNDVKGLLLTCVAPELDTNPDTDIFKSCTLAPGRTLDDVMHTFIQALHFVQNQQLKERTGSNKDPDEESAQKPAEK